jgi:hypothetical protein
MPTIADLRAILSARYAPAVWRDLLHGVFGPAAQLFARPNTVVLEDETVRAASHLGDLRTVDGKTAAILDIELVPDGSTNLRRNRAGLRALAAKFIDGINHHAILAVFHAPGQNLWRFSFIIRETTLDLATGQTLRRETPAKRFTYLLGPEESCATAARRFLELAEKQSAVSLQQIEDAFSIEKLSKDFFSGYIEHYKLFAQDAARHRRLADWNADSEKPLRDFIKRLLGRLVFLHFLQKKGWMGCPASSKKWEGGNPGFTRFLFENCKDQSRFYTKVLRPLYFQTLNCRRDKDLVEFPGTGCCRVPYLNGGLFEENDYEKPFQFIDFPAERFATLFEFFSQFNFTIDENDPADREVGIDPEMLGRIFEALLEDNKEKGAYYTPKAIVAYMCRESLLHYLKTKLFGTDNAKCPSPAANAELEAWVRAADKELSGQGNAFVTRQAKAIEQALREVKICDPAIGSGAFPMGLLQEIWHARLALSETLGKPVDSATIKKEIIQNCIYGVDLDGGAVDIARLRFWLSLVVDEDKPSPLPNLDYKIMQGNSLLESFEGIDLSRIREPKKIRITELAGGAPVQPDLGIFDDFAIERQEELTVNQETADRVTELMHAYFGETNPEKKRSTRNAIDTKVREHIEFNLNLQSDQMKNHLAILHADIDGKKKYAGYKPPAKQLKQIAGYETELAELDRKAKELRKLADSDHRPYFLWNLFFHDAMEHGGFDIVIANPPYVRQESIKAFKAELKEHYECFDGAADLFVYFFEKGISLLRPGGVFTYICSNKYFRSGYGELLRDFMTRELSIHQLIDFGDAPVFEAIAYPSIILAQRREPGIAPAATETVQALTWVPGPRIEEFPGIFASQCFSLAQCELRKDGWRLESPKVLRLLDKLRKAGTPLGEYVQGKFYRGLLTGLNEAFVLDRATRDRLIAEDVKSVELLKPFLRGRDVKRWRVEFAEQYLIKIESSENKKHPWSGKPEAEAERIFAKTYPAIHAFMQPLRDKLIAREDQGHYFWELRSCAYWNEFNHAAIIYPELALVPQYAYSATGWISDCTLYIIPNATAYLVGVLNSSIVGFFFEQISPKVRGGYMRFKALYMNQIPIPNATPAQQAAITKLVERILAAKVADPVADVSDLEAEINTRVATLFDLIPEEIIIIEEKI